MKDKAIWIDKEKAHVLTIKGENIEMVTVSSNYNDLYQENTDRQGGATEVLKDRKVLEREKQITKQFFEALSDKLEDAKRIIIMGPAQMGQHFSKYLNQEKPSIGKRVVELKKSEQMTDNQLKAAVKAFYLSTS